MSWLRLVSAKSQSAMYKYRCQVIRLFSNDVFKDTLNQVNLFFFTNDAIFKKKPYAIA